MTSKQLGTVIQRAISDGAFRRQLQSDPTSALRGFDLTSDEVAAIRGGDPTKLSSLGVDQRLSKTFALGDALGSVSRSSTVSDLNTSGSTTLPDGGAAGGQNALSDVGRTDGQALISDGGSDGVAHDAARFGNADGASDGIIGDPTNSRALHDDAPADTGTLISSDNTAGTRAVHDDAPADTGTLISSDNTAGTRAVHDDAPADTGTLISTGAADGSRAVHDDAPADTGTYVNSGAADGTRAVHDDAPSDTGTLAASSDGSDRYGDAFITADEAGRYGVAGHTDAAVNAEAGGDADLSQTVISPGSTDSSDGHSTGDALGDGGTNEHSWG